MIDYPVTGLGLKYVKALLNAIKAERAPHAVMITGPRGTGKMRVARFLAQALVCTGEDPPCGECASCKQFAEDGHIDVKIVAAEERSISVDDIRALLEYLANRPFSAKRHVVIIEQAEKMTPQAQNALLKTLEAPSGDNVIFLSVDLSGALLPTIVSRCLPVRLSPLKLDECERLLIDKGVGADIARRAARLAQGCVARAEEIAADDDYLKLEDSVRASFAALKTSLGAHAAAALLPGGRDRALDALDIIEVSAREQLLTRRGVELLSAVIDARKRLASNVSSTSVIEGMYIKIAGGH